MKVFIIGGTGLISTAITRQLLAAGHDVTLYNRGQTAARFPDGAKVITGNRYDHAVSEKQFAEAGEFDCVIDMICYNPESAESLIRAMKGKTKQFIFCSTVDVYMKPATKFPYTEAEPRTSLSDYGRNKVICEDLFLASGVPTTIIRPAATYGEGGNVIHTLGWDTSFVDRMRRGLPVIVMGDGSALWTMCHVDDEATAFVGAIGNERAYGKSYHATGEEWMTWNEFHHTISRAMGWPEPKIVHIPTVLMTAAFKDKIAITTLNFQFTNIYDNSAAKNDLGFRYTVPFEAGIKRTIDFMIEAGRVAPAESDPFYDQILAAWESASAGFVGALAK